jgi:cytochrome P450
LFRQLRSVRTHRERQAARCRRGRPYRRDQAKLATEALAYGQDAHFCVGASLTRLEAAVAFDALLRRAPGLRLAVPAERLRWRRSFIVRGMEALPVRA